MEIRFFDQTIEDFIERLEKPVYAKTLRALDLLKKFGSALGMPHRKKIDRDLFELRVQGGQKVRIIYVFHKKGIILLYGFIKKTWRIPGHFILLSRKRLKILDYI